MIKLGENQVELNIFEPSPAARTSFLEWPARWSTRDAAAQHGLSARRDKDFRLKGEKPVNVSHKPGVMHPMC